MSTARRRGEPAAGQLDVQVDGQWRSFAPGDLVEEILQVRVHRATPARDEARGGTVGPLERRLHLVHFRALSTRLLQAVQGLYAESGALGLPVLEQRVADLAQWDLVQPAGRHLALRLKWLAAWLAELLGRVEVALARYRDFLGLRPRRDEPQLTLLARNNEAVLRLRQGDLSGLPRLARVALAEELPGACFSLLNVVNVASTQGWLATVDDLLVPVLNRFGPAAELYWLGRPPAADPPADAAETADGEPQPVKRSLCREPGALDHFIERLLEPASRLETEGAAAAAELRLWPLPRALLVAGESRAPLQGQAACAEAVTLLYVRDLPDFLNRSASLPTATEVLAAQQLAEARQCADADGENLEPALALLAAAQALLGDAARTGPRTVRLRKEIAALRKEIRARQHDRLLLECRRQLAELKRQVEDVCRLDELTAAQQRRLLLEIPCRQVQELQKRVWPNKNLDLTEPLRQRLDAHLARLERRECAARLQGPYQRLQALLPGDLSAPVPTEAFEVLHLCRLADPRRLVQDWDKLRRAFESHDARHYFHRAWLTACDRAGRDREALEGLLIQSLAREPGFAPSAAPLLALLCLPAEDGPADSFDQIRQELLQRAERLVTQHVLGGEVLLPPAVRRDLVAEASLCLRRVVEVLRSRETDDQAVAELTRRLWNGFQPVLRRGQPADVEAVRQILDEWKAVCKTWIDPRHPLWLALHDVQVSGLLAEARQQREKGDAASALALTEQALQLGLLDREQAWTAVWLYALARPQTGSVRRQAEVLEALQHRTRAASDEVLLGLKAEDVERWLTEIEQGR
jgi:hypothetical protein